MQSAEQLGQRIGIEAACDALSVPRSSLYRARRPNTQRSRSKISPRAFSQAEKTKVREELNRCEPIVELGYHQIAGTLQVDLLLPVCHFRCVQPLRGWLDDRGA